jgi:folate-binding Fe-S cluster repair protein YgfZ
MTPQRELLELRAVRENAGLFQLPERGVLEVRGEDRVRWLDGMISADVKGLAAGEGAPGLLLTQQGRIVADLHVLARSDGFWLELEASALPAVSRRLAGYVIADDVARSRSGDLRPRSKGLVRASGSRQPAQTRAASLPHAWRERARRSTGHARRVRLQRPRWLGSSFRRAADVVCRSSQAASRLPRATRLSVCASRRRAWLGGELDETVLPARHASRPRSPPAGCYTGRKW